MKDLQSMGTAFKKYTYSGLETNTVLDMVCP